MITSHVSHLSIIGQCRANCRIMQPKPLNWVNNGYGALLATVYIQTTLRELPNALFVVYGIKKKSEPMKMKIDIKKISDEATKL